MTSEDQHDVLFRLSDVDDFDQLMGRWSALIARAPYGVDSVVALWRESSTYYENKLIAASSALEALDRGLHGDHGLGGRGPSYAARCAKLIAIPDPEAVRMLVGDPDQWATDMKKARNDLAHGYPPDERKTPAGVWYALKDGCRAVLALVLMAELGLPPEIQRRAVKIGGLRRCSHAR
ncbi:HEPN domain-containing protein [Rhodococcus kronopolitis]|uniref:HEPN domain-containing protein n=1 Tax=Rhodococcus kronopolitis TaxID=1460226 RepID=A0ABV9FM38_9NOCA